MGKPTLVTEIRENKIFVRGIPLEKLISDRSFAASIYTVLQGREPSEAEEAVINAILVSLIDHGLDTPSTHATLAVQRGGNPINVAVGAGILAQGEAHGGAIERAARMLQGAAKRPGEAPGVADEIVGVFAASKQRVPGYGHDLHKRDPRTQALMEKAREKKLFGRHCEIALAVQDALEKRYGQNVPLNVFGATAALISELGFDWRMGRSFFVLGRTVGVIGQAFEEIRREAPLDELGDVPWENGPTGDNGDFTPPDA